METRICPASGVDQLRPRAAWFGLKALWAGGGCTPQAADGLAGEQPYDPSEYPGCGPTMGAVRGYWYEHADEWLRANASVREDMASRGGVVWLWVARVGGVESTCRSMLT